MYLTLLFRPMSDLEYREYRPSDLNGLKDLVSEIWSSVLAGFGPEHEEDLVWHFVYHYLGQTNAAKVALMDGKIVGFVGGHIFAEPMGQMAKDAIVEQNNIRSRLEEEGSCEPAFYFYDWVDVMCDKAKNMAGGSFDSELVLFAVSPSMQGNGVGKKLLKELGFKGGMAGRYYFYTTGNCNVGFYTHSGYRLVCEETFRYQGMDILEWYLFSNDPSSN